jgi:hypothetical protein
LVFSLLLVETLPHQYDARVQEQACHTLRKLSDNRYNQVTLVSAVPYIIRAMNRHQDDARLQDKACSVLRKLAVDYGLAESCIVRAMSLHPYDADVQREACGALRNLAVYKGEAKACIIRAVVRHSYDSNVQREAIKALSVQQDRETIALEACGALRTSGKGVTITCRLWDR